jgi:hypothetical protein
MQTLRNAALRDHSDKGYGAARDIIEGALRSCGAFAAGPRPRFARIGDLNAFLA